MTIGELKRRKKELGYTNQQIADLAAVPLGTVQKIFSGATASPRYETLLKLERVLQKPLFPSEKPGMDANFRSVSASVAAEPRRTYSTGNASRQKDPDFDPARQGSFTYSDYLALPDERRVELIDGVFYDMAAPNTRHQVILGELYLQLRACSDAHPGCMVLLSPSDVMLDEDDRTVVQPDIMVLCDRSKMRKGRIFGAPDFIIEIVSPGSVTNDYTRKAMKYMNAGVREYWIIDYRRRKVVVFLNDQEYDDTANGPDIFLHGIDEIIPISISDETCSLDIGKIAALLDSLGDI